MFKNIAGNVLFDHKEHTWDKGYGLKCTECHHDIDKEGKSLLPAGSVTRPRKEKGRGRYGLMPFTSSARDAMRTAAWVR